MFQGLLQDQLQFIVIPGFADVTVDLAFVDRLDDRREVGIPGQQDAAGGGIHIMHLGQQRGPVHARHARIAHDQVDGL